MTTGQIRPVTCDGPETLQDLVREAHAQQSAIVDYGRAHAGLGHAAPPEHFALQLAGGIIEHYERDLTVRVAGGCTLGLLRAALTSTGQFCPIDADEDLTLSEIINHHVYGPLRVRYGSVRDHLLGLAFIDGQGRDIRVGGRTVKNVAGYDLTRFMVGSLGEMGLLHEATLRTYAIPQQVALAQVRVADPTQLDAALTDWLLSDAAPTTLALTHTAEGWQATVGYFGREEACAVQGEALGRFVALHEGLELTDKRTTDLAGYFDWSARLRAWRRSSSAVVKVIVPPSCTGQVAQLGAELKLIVEALPAHGCVFLGGAIDAAAARQLDERLLALLAQLGGMRAWMHRPEDAQELAPFAPVQSDWPMLRQLKQTLDPGWLFNPGRLLAREGWTS